MNKPATKYKYLNIMNKKQDLQLIWETYANENQEPLPAGRVGHLHTDQPGGEIGNMHGQETPVLEGVNCSCSDCIHWVVGDLCGAKVISLSKIPNDDYGAVVVCETFETGGSDEG